MASVARHVFVSGRVQGVGFRWFVSEQARALGLAGWVRNLRDGRVEAWIEGNSEAVDAMLARLREGKRPARVEDLAATEVEAADFGNFEVR
ncbi:MAG TPA: acylphosphatase [Planctomycetota bacterium]|nr:acylphosphatase [Planctomycetota bacterium]